MGSVVAKVKTLGLLMVSRHAGFGAISLEGGHTQANEKHPDHLSENDDVRCLRRGYLVHFSPDKNMCLNLRVRLEDLCGKVKN